METRGLTLTIPLNPLSHTCQGSFLPPSVHPCLGLFWFTWLVGTLQLYSWTPITLRYSSPQVVVKISVSMETWGLAPPLPLSCSYQPRSVIISCKDTRGERLHSTLKFHFLGYRIKPGIEWKLWWNQPSMGEMPLLLGALCSGSGGPSSQSSPMGYFPPWHFNAKFFHFF